MLRFFLSPVGAAVFLPASFFSTGAFPPAGAFPPVEGFFSAAFGGILGSFRNWTGKRNESEERVMDVVDVGRQDYFVVGKD